MITEQSPVGREQYDPFLPPTRDDPYPAWAQLRAERPVFYSQALDAWVVTRYEDICAVVRDPARFANSGTFRPLVPPPPEVQAILDEGYPFEAIPPFIATDPPLHTRLRKFANAAFTNQRVAELEPRIREVAAELLEAMVASGRGRADFVSRFAFRLPLTVVGDLIGVPREDHDRLHQWSGDRLALHWVTALPLEEQKALARSFVEFQRYCAELIEARRQSPRDDIISDLLTLRLEDEQPLTSGELIGQMMGLVSAGHETTMNLLAHALFHLLRHPAQWAALRADPTGLAPRAVEETLRYDSPVSGMWRIAAEAATLGEVTIPAGARIQLLFGSANRDEAAFPDAPDRFDITRPPSPTGAQHLAFGRGAHFCLGANLARLEGRIALELIATRLPSLRLDPDAGPVVWRPNAAFRGPAALPIAWDD